MLVKMGIFPKDRGEHKKYLSCHHPVIFFDDNGGGMISKKFMQNIILPNSTSSQFGVSKNNGTPKWMVKIMENTIKMDDLGVPLFLETPKKTMWASR